MPSSLAQYRQKLTAPEKAVELIRNGDTVLPSPLASRPPAMLAAIADRAGAGDLRDIRLYCLLRKDRAANTLLSPDL